MHTQSGRRAVDAAGARAFGAMPATVTGSTPIGIAIVAAIGAMLGRRSVARKRRPAS
jgi:hypothetical protein